MKMALSQQFWPMFIAGIMISKSQHEAKLKTCEICGLA